MKFHCDSTEFGRALNNALLYTCKPSENRPILTQVQFVVTPHTLTLVATDSYALYRETVTCDASGDEGSETAFDVDGVMLATIAKAASGNKSPARIVFDVDDSDITVTVGAQTFQTRHGMIGEFPHWRQLIPADDKFGVDAFPVVGIAQWQLARLGKIKTGGSAKGATAHVKFVDELKPFIVTFGTTINVLLMPTRLG